MNAPRFIGLLILLAACDPPADPLAEAALVLPPSLHEVSGIVAVDDHTIACVQDEVGAIFFVDLRGVEDARVASFGPSGDYEGIAFTGAEYWVLRSDGLLLRLSTRDNAFEIVESHRLRKDCEYEGLCYDAANERLLVVTKGPVSDKKRERHRRRVFAFDLRRNQLVSAPVLTFRRDDLIKQAKEQALALPTRITAKGKERIDLELRGSEIVTVPGGSELLLLSGPDGVLLRVSADGKLVGTTLLDGDVLPQPEAMTFLPDGRLVVASEGQNGPAVMVVVDYR